MGTDKRNSQGSIELSQEMVRGLSKFTISENTVVHVDLEQHPEEEKKETLQVDLPSAPSMHSPRSKKGLPQLISLKDIKKLEHLGQGAGGLVHKAIHLPTKTKIALKVFLHIQIQILFTSISSFLLRQMSK